MQRAIDRLGRPAEFLRPMLADELIARGTTRYSPPLISCGLYHAMRFGSDRALRAGLFALGYLTLAQCVLLYVLLTRWLRRSLCLT